LQVVLEGKSRKLEGDGRVSNAGVLRELRMTQAALPRDAFFAEAEQVPIAEAVGRVCAEMLTPYPPGIPAALPGERLTAPVLDYLASGVRGGMVIPDAADTKLGTIRVTREIDPD
jgi:arginine/lysine/ornithine decarboxylase